MKKTTGSAESTMKRAEVFISATSGDLRTVREVVKQGVLTMGCFPVEQGNFPPDYRSVSRMIEERIAGCDAVVHIVGRRYGAEPDPGTLPPGEARRSYTQMEAEAAARLGKKLYVFVCPEDFPYDEEPDVESAEKRTLQAAYRERVSAAQTLHTPVRDRDELALKVRELQFEMERLHGKIARGGRRTFAMMTALLLVLCMIAGGVWWTAHRVAGAFHYDRNRTREMLAAAIEDKAGKMIAKLNPVDDWRQIKEIKDEENGQLGDLDRLLDGIEQTSNKGEASASYVTATKLLQEKGVGEALAYLDATSGDRATQIDAQKSRRDVEEAELRKLLQEELLAASLLEKQFRFDEAEARYRKIVAEAGAWAEPRNDFAWFLVQRGRFVDPAHGDAMLREAVTVSQGTLALISKESAPMDWAKAENLLGAALGSLAERDAGDAGVAELRECIAAYHRALEVRTKEEHPQEWASTESNLGNELTNLGERVGGEAGKKLFQSAIDAFNGALEVTPKDDPTDGWVMLENNLAIALADMGERTPGADGDQYIAKGAQAYRDILAVKTKEAFPQMWATAQNNLGNALEDAGMRTDGDAGKRYLQEAIEAFNHSLEVRTQQNAPQNWATTESNLGNALDALAERTNGREAVQMLRDAASADLAALKVRTRTFLPQDYADTENNLGNVMYDFGTRITGTGGCPLLKDAVGAYSDALAVMSRPAMPAKWARTELSLGETLVALGEHAGGDEGKRDLQQAAAVLGAAQEVYTKEAFATEWREAQQSLDEARGELGKMGGGAQAAASASP